MEVKIEKDVRRLIHYSRQPLGRVVSAAHDPGRAAGFAKTPGLWVSVEGEDDWPSWCLAEGYGLERLAHATEIRLKGSAKILRIENAEGIDAFTRRFVDEELTAPDWRRVRAEFQGLIIAPYVWSRRLSHHAFWYYGWDCASGVIWDAEAIAETRPLPPAPALVLLPEITKP